MNSQAMSEQLYKIMQGSEIVAAGADYLTVTSQNESAKEVLLYIFNRGAAQAERLGDQRKKAGFQGFQGWRVGPWFYGRREELWLLRVQGPAAHEIYHDVPWPLVHCSRVDVQMTVRTKQHQPALAQLVGDIRAAYAKEKKIKLTPVQDLKGVYGGGQTLYTGSRESPRFGRVYDKESQSGHEAYERCWRFEVEYKKVCAPLVGQWLCQEPDLKMAAIQSVVGQYEAWGVALAVGVVGKLIAGSIGRRDYDSERVLKWLSTQVAPSIEKLLATVDRTTIEEALGLAVCEDGPLPEVTRQRAAETDQPALAAETTSQARRDARKWW